MPANPGSYIPVAACSFLQGKAKTTRMTFLRQCARKLSQSLQITEGTDIPALLSVLRCGEKLFRTVLCRDCAALRLGHYDPSSDSTLGSNSEAALHKLLPDHIASITKQRSLKCSCQTSLFCQPRIARK